MRLPQHLNLPYDEISRLLEKVPGGLTLDQLSSKLFCIKRLKKKDVDALLQYCQERDRIEVSSILRKGVNTSPLLRHRIHAGKPTEANTSAVDTPDNTVHVATPGRAVIQPIVKETIVMPTPNETLSAKEEFMAERPHLRDVAAAILEGLKAYPNGLTRSELRNIAPTYHRLRGDNRNDVIAYLIEFEGVREINPDNKVRGARLYYPGHYEALTQTGTSQSSIDLFNQHAAADDFDDEDEDLTDSDNVGNLLQPGEAPHYQETVVDVASIGERIVQLLKDSEESEIAMSDLYEHIPAYAMLNDNERRNCTRRLLEAGVIGMGRRTSPYSVGAGTLKIWLITDDTKDTVVHQQADKNSMGQSAMALALQQAMANSKKSVTPTKVHLPASDITLTLKEPALDDRQRFASAEPAVPAPVVETPVVETQPAEAVESTPETAADVRARIQQLEAVARRLEAQERDTAVRNAILPLRNELQSEYDRMEKAVNEQIDALAAMGDILGRIDAVLGADHE